MLASLHNSTRARIPTGRLEKAFSILERKVPKLKKAELSLVFVGPGRMRALNKSYRGKDKPTDVLSFDTGDIFISPAQARKQSSHYHREVVLLAVHGALHVAGMDHDTPRKEKKMFGLQEEITKKAFS